MSMNVVWKDILRQSDSDQFVFVLYATNVYTSETLYC